MRVHVGFPITAKPDLLNEAFQGNDTMLQGIAKLPIDITEMENETQIVAELPGVKKEEVSVKFEDGILTIRGERKSSEVPNTARVLLREMHVQSVERSVRFNIPINESGITAELENGILRVRVPKADEARSRTIEIR